MAQPLITSTDVFVRTWHEGKKYLGADLKHSIWLLVLALISFALAIISFYLPNNARLVIHVLDILLLQVIGTSWIGLRLTSSILTERQGKKDKVITLTMLGSFLLISLLSGLAAAGGALAFVFPGIWLTVALTFAGYVYLDEGRTGRQALAASAELVKGRWWSTCARLVLPGFPILVISILAGSIIESIVSLIAGYSPSSLVDQVGLLNWTILAPAPVQIASSALQVINTIPFLIAVPFLTHLAATVYLELKRTR